MLLNVIRTCLKYLLQKMPSTAIILFVIYLSQQRDLLRGNDLYPVSFCKRNAQKKQRIRTKGIIFKSCPRKHVLQHIFPTDQRKRL